MTVSHQIFQGDALKVLRKLPDESVNCIVCSPPYWRLRDYGVKGQLGLESTPEAYIRKLVQVFRECRRVLKKDGTLWINMGDSYAGNGCAYGDEKSTLQGTKQAYRSGPKRERKNGFGCKPKDLMGMPWRVAFALQKDGWFLRQDIVWHKSNPMPESVTDRCTKAHEYIFLLSKSARYHYDMDAIKEEVSGNAHARGTGVNPKAAYKTPDGWDTSVGNGGHGGFHKEGREKGKSPSKSSRVRVTRMAGGRPPQARQNESFSAAVCGLVDFRNKRSVWTIPTQSYSGAHFATFPEDLPRTCILAGCPPGGVVLDPFAGSGTTVAVALQLGRNGIGIELNPEYISLIHKRLSEVTPGMVFEVAS